MEDNKNWMIHLGCAVAIFGVVALMTIKVAEDLDADQYTLSFINVGVLCFVEFPTLVAFLFIHIKDWVNKTTSGFSWSKTENEKNSAFRKSEARCCSCICVDTFKRCCINFRRKNGEMPPSRRNYGTDLQDEEYGYSESSSVNICTKIGRFFTRKKERPGGNDENISLIQSVRQNVGKGCSVIKDKFRRPSDKMTERLISSSNDKPNGNENGEEVFLNDRGERTHGNITIHERVSKTLNTIRKPFRNSDCRSLTSEEIFRRHFNLTSPNKADTKTRENNDYKEASTSFATVNIKKENGIRREPQNKNEKITSRHAASAPKHNNKKSSIGVDNQTAIAASKTNSIDNQGSGKTRAKPGVPVIAGNGTSVGRDSVDRGKRKMVKHSVEVNQFASGREIENGKSIAINPDDHEDSDGSQKVIEEVFRQYFGLQNPPSNVIEYARINADSKKSQSKSKSLDTAGIGKDVKKTPKGKMRTIPESDDLPKDHSRPNREERMQARNKDRERKTEDEFGNGEASRKHSKRASTSNDDSQNKRSSSNSDKEIAKRKHSESVDMARKKSETKNETNVDANSKERNESGIDHLQNVQKPRNSLPRSSSGKDLTDEDIFRSYFNLPDPSTASGRSKQRDSEPIEMAVPSVVSHNEQVDRINPVQHERQSAPAGILKNDSMLHTTRGFPTEEVQELHHDIYTQRLNSEQPTTNPVDYQNRADRHTDIPKAPHTINDTVDGRVSRSGEDLFDFGGNSETDIKTYIDGSRNYGEYDSGSRMASGAYHGNEHQSGTISMEMPEMYHENEKRATKMKEPRTEKTVSILEVSNLPSTSTKNHKIAAKSGVAISETVPEVQNRMPTRSKYDTWNDTRGLGYTDSDLESQAARMPEHDVSPVIDDSIWSNQIHHTMPPTSNEYNRYNEIPNADSLSVTSSQYEAFTKTQPQYDGNDFYSNQIHHTHTIPSTSNEYNRYNEIPNADCLSVTPSQYEAFTETQPQYAGNDFYRNKPIENVKRQSASPAPLRRGRHAIEVDSDEERILMMIRQVKEDTKHMSNSRLEPARQQHKPSSSRSRSGERRHDNGY